MIGACVMAFMQWVKSSESDIYYSFTLHLLLVAWAVHCSTLHHLNSGYSGGPEGITSATAPAQPP